MFRSFAVFRDYRYCSVHRVRVYPYLEVKRCMTPIQSFTRVGHCVRGHRKRWTGFSESTITGVVYLDLLDQYVFPQIETSEQETVSRVIFMQDGAPSHFSCFVTDVLNERLPDAWIGRGGPIPWPPRSPDLSLYLIFSCGGTLRTLCMLRR